MNKLFTLAAIFAALQLTACVSDTTELLADGGTGHTVICNGSANTIQDCRNRADDVCGGHDNYTVVKKIEREDTYLINESSIAVNSKNGESGSIAVRAMAIRCNAPQSHERMD